MDDGVGMTQIGCNSRMPDIHPPEILKTKVSGKRLKGGKEKAVEQSNKIKRLCRGCNELANHYKRNCPKLKKRLLYQLMIVHCLSLKLHQPMQTTMMN
ncbi:hypothetical protein H6P81_016593 [Aristolochia fimbriata]|uniref:Uncharacterized protein n=1 Tax=Aristolochia fimbriata TaxID=158543 RepID=A0AAV7E8V8_ARIFI|nr:hypothetical protein H6P81_016593 [Aristolochia fimbriata]